jgi:uncharacterized protein (TIGR03083 family)
VSPATRQPTAAVDFVEQYAAAAERFALAVAWSDLRSAVPACPDWTTYDLVVHLANVHAWAATIVETGSAAPEQDDEPRGGRGRARAVSEWYTGKAEDLYAVLRHTPPDRPCWNFVFGSGVAGFWPRRQLHEVTVHQIDLDQAAGRDTVIDAQVAADGVDEVLTVLSHRMHHRGFPAAIDRPLALTASDTGDTWILTPPPRSGQPPRVPEQPAGRHAAVPSPGVAATRTRTVAVGVEDRVEATADVLYRTLWKRLPFERAHLRLSGDPSRLRAFLGSRLVP